MPEKPTIIEMSSAPRGDATIKFETAGDADVLLVLSMMAPIELEAMLAKASQEQAKNQPVQRSAERCQHVFPLSIDLNHRERRVKRHNNRNRMPHRVIDDYV